MPSLLACGKSRSGSEPGARFADSRDDALLKALQLVFAQGAIGSLKCGAEKKRVVFEAEARIVKDLAYVPLDELGDVQCGERLIDCLPRNALIEDEREVTAHGLEPGDVASAGLAQRQLVEAVEVDFADVDSFFELARRSLPRMQLAEPADG